MGRDEEDFAADAVGSAADLVLPGSGFVMGRLSRAVATEWRQNASKALRAAERVSGLSREDLEERIAGDPALVPLLTRLLYTAGMTGQEQTLRAMGAALGDAVRDPARVGDAELILMGLAELREQHVALLRMMLDDPADVEFRRPAEADRARWMTKHIAEQSPLALETTELCLAGLLNAGLLRSLNVWDGLAYECTDLGLTVLQVLDELDAPGRG